MHMSPCVHRINVFHSSFSATMNKSKAKISDLHKAVTKKLGETIITVGAISLNGRNIK